MRLGIVKNSIVPGQLSMKVQSENARVPLTLRQYLMRRYQPREPRHTAVIFIRARDDTGDIPVFHRAGVSSGGAHGVDKKADLGMFIS